MTIRFHTAARVGTVQTLGNTPATVVEYDLSNSALPLGAFDNQQICATALVLAYTSSAANQARMSRQRSFSRISATLTELDVATVVLGTDLLLGTLAPVLSILDASGDSIRVRVTGVAATTIQWTGFLWLYGSNT